VIEFHINPGGDLTIYRQIVAQVLDAAAGGRLKPGDPLPSLEKVSSRNSISPLTVKKAYDELERKGMVETRRGLGTFLTKQASTAGREARLDELQLAVRQLVVQAQLIGLPAAELMAMVKQAGRDLESERKLEATDRRKNS